MNITKEKAQDIRSVESALIAGFNLDINDQSFPFSKLFNDKLCTDQLSECAAPNYCKSIYLAFIAPIYFYLEYRNNYLTVGKIAEHNEMSESDAQLLINNGRNLLNELLEVERVN